MTALRRLYAAARRLPWWAQALIALVVAGAAWLILRRVVAALAVLFGLGALGVPLRRDRQSRRAAREADALEDVADRLEDAAPVVDPEEDRAADERIAEAAETTAPTPSDSGMAPRIPALDEIRGRRR
ncbi:MAG: hypothetical protein Q8Q14_16170 [Gemmatimonadales bacterium]|nr:hypothetical protein [Gemmatimonadales bacterium]